MTAIWPAGPPNESMATRSHTQNASSKRTPWPASASLALLCRAVHHAFALLVGQL